MRVITFGTYDLFHIGHLNILKRCKDLGDYLIVGVSSDELNEKKGKKSINSLEERLNIIKSNIYVDEVFVEDSLEMKDEYIKKYKADLLIMGDDWKDKFNWVSCKVLYLERTSDISTTLLKGRLNFDIEDKIKTLFPNSDYNKQLYLPTCSILNCKSFVYTEFIHSQAVIFFKTLDYFNLDYYVFAGSSIGLLRDSKNIPWIDDYDIMIFPDQVELFENKVLPCLEKNGFKYKFNDENLIRKNTFVLSNHAFNFPESSHNYFQCDIFYSYVTADNIVRNNYNFGIYDKKKLNIDIIKPKKYYLFNGIRLPFFNDVQKDISIEYGDIYNITKIHIEHNTKGLIFNTHFTIVYKKFNEILNKSIENTKLLIKNNVYNIDDLNVIETENISYEDDNINNFKILTYINNNNIKTLTLPIKLLKYACTINFYYPDIILSVNIYNYYDHIHPHLNFINNVYITENILSQYDNELMFWYKKPLFILDK